MEENKYLLALRASSLVCQAIRKGILERPTICELCSFDLEAIKQLNARYKGRIVGHHWNGYENPLDVWFVCESCNKRLGNRHDGSLSKEQARGLLRIPSNKQ